MTVTTTTLLQLRYRVADGVLLDWADLARLVEPPASITVQALREHWHCTQPAVSRRMGALQRAGLARITPGWGRYRVWAVSGLEVAA